MERLQRFNFLVEFTWYVQKAFEVVSDETSL